MEFLKRSIASKTFWAAAAAILGAVGTVCTGEMAWQQAVPVIVTAVVGVFVRDGAVKAAGK